MHDASNPPHASLADLLDGMDDAALVLDGDDRVAYANAAATRLLAADAASADPMALPPAWRDPVRSLRARLAEGEADPTAVLARNGSALRLRARGDGETLQLVARSVRFRAAEGAAAPFDSGEGMHAMHLRLLHRVQRAVAGRSELRSTAVAALDAIVNSVDVAACLVVEEEGVLRTVACRGLRRGPTTADALPGVTALVDEALRAGDLRSVDGETLRTRFGPLAGEEGWRAGHVLPFDRDDARGGLVVLGRFPLPRAEDERPFHEALAGTMAGTVATVRLLERADRTARDHEAVARFGEAIESLHDVGGLLEHGLTFLVRHLGFDRALVTSPDEEGRMVPQASVGEDGAALAVFPAPAAPPEGGAVARALRSGEPATEVIRRGVGRGERTALALPVRVGGEVRHVVALHRAGPGAAIDAKTTAIATTFARRLENALARVDDLEEIRATREATFRILGLALEVRDYETKGHTDRVADLAVRFGRELGLGDDDLQALTWGAYLHDIGKIGVPDRILSKPGRLDEEEFELIRRHPVVGERMCRDVPFLPRATLAVVRHHHERWDGSGYPDGLAGEAIPLFARLFSLVDVYDALTNHRPYKAAWTPEAAMAEIRRGAGTQFDPRLTAAFERVAPPP